MRKSDACPKCGMNKDVRAKQCKTCRKIEQQSTKEQTRKNRYNLCGCGAKKLKHARKCRKCADSNLRINSLHKCQCGDKKSPKSKTCKKCYLKSVNPVDGGNIYCKYCNRNLPVSEFYGHASKWSGVRSRCKKCWQKDSRIRARKRKLASCGVPKPAKYAELLDGKKVRCRICNMWLSEGSWHIDHDHKTGYFRGFLCNGCNTGLGQFKDNPKLLRAAAEYIEINEGVQPSSLEFVLYDTILNKEGVKQIPRFK